MSARPRILVAGIGNVFLGDDAFGVEVAQQLSQRSLPDEVRVTDYGIRGFDLAFALLDEWDTVVIVDATSQGGKPGTLYLIEADVDAEGAAAQPDHDQGGFQGHLMTPAAVFALVRSLGGKPGRVLIVGCEPESLGPENEGRMGLSETVAGVVPAAVERVEHLVTELLAAAATANARGHAHA
ncbi:MAG TPA: hydrogenase maturation protease [Candidatus Dormibacteraeota bacterium]